MFRRFLAASGLANLGDGIATLAWVWVASTLTRDAALIALVPVALRLPWAIFAIPAGIVADRVDRRRLVIAMDAVRALAFLAAAGALTLRGEGGPAPMEGVSSVPLFVALVLCAMTVGIAEVFRDNAAQTLLPSIVPDQGLERANGRLWTTEALANQLIGPAFGAFLLGAALALPFAFNALAYGAAAILMTRLQGQFHPGTPVEARWRAAFVTAWRYLMGQRLLVLLAVVTGLWNMTFEATLFALVLHAQENLGLSAQEYGFVLTAFALGGALAGLIGDKIALRLGAGRTLRLSLLVSAAMLLLVPLAPNGWLLAATFVVFEMAGITWNIVSVSLRQRMIPDELRGRVNSLYRLLAWGMIPIGIALSGWLIGLAEGWIGRAQALTVPIWVAGGLMLAMAILVQGPLQRGLDQARGRQ
ncbi:MAG: MFS transporter [Tabrizicola sp.]|nr:MFS transporter [Tabrizicola sp.]